MNDRRLEHFPDELLIEICRYLNTFEILHSFTGLNTRFSKTISEFTKTIDLNSIPLRLINHFLNQIFPHINSNIHRLIFPDDLRRFPLDLDQFDHLECIHYSNHFNEDFPRTIEEIQIDLVSNDLQADLLEILFSSTNYSNLKSLSLSSYHGFTFSNIQWKNSTQIKSLKINLKNNVDLFELLYLLSSSIEYLNIHILYNGPFKSSSSKEKELKLDKLHYFHLKTTFEDSIKFKQLEKFLLQSFRSLEHLSIETLTRDSFYIDGYQWEKLLIQLIHLKNFFFSIRFRFPIDQSYDHQSREENLFQSFSTDFWLYQRKWFINSYSTIPNFEPTCHYRTKIYGKLFIHSIPYPYEYLDATIDINRAKSTMDQCFDSLKFDANIYSNVRHLYYDGEEIPRDIEQLKTILHQFKYLKELKFDRLIIDSSPSLSYMSYSIKLSHLNKLIIYNNNENVSFDLSVLHLSSIPNLRYIRIPQILLPDCAHMPKQLETLILTECRDWNFDFVHRYQHLRRLRLFLNNFDRLLENYGQLLNNLIKSIYTNNQTIESLQLMCHGVSQTKVKAFEKQFNTNPTDYLTANYDGKSLTIERLIDFYY